LISQDAWLSRTSPATSPHEAEKFNARSMRRLIARRIDRNSFGLQVQRKEQTLIDRDPTELSGKADSSGVNPYLVELVDNSMLPTGPITKLSRWRWLALVGAACGPFFLSACFIVITREWVVVDDTTWDFVGFAVGLAVGVCCLWALPISRLLHVLLTLIYIPVLGLTLFDFILLFIGQRYNLWL